MSGEEDASAELPGRPAVIAHRGAAAERPENTLPAFDLAIELGADGLELDVRRTADGTLIVLHDATLDRTTDASGAVAGLSYAEILGADAGARSPGWEGPPLPVPTLAETLERYPAVEITLDVKDPGAAAAVVTLVDRLARTERTILYVEEGVDSSAFRDYAGRRATSTAQALWLAEALEAAGPDPVSLATRSGRPGALPEGFPEVVHTPLEWEGRRIVGPDFPAAVRRLGRWLQVWTVDDPELMVRLATWGVDAIITNDVRAAIRRLGATPGGTGRRAR